MSGPLTVRYPQERLRFSSRFRGRHLLSFESCIGCGACGWICPIKAIVLIPVQGASHRYPQIDYGKCSFCGFCTEICPTSALSATDLVELSTYTRQGLIYTPEQLARRPSLEEVVPKLKRELTVEVKDSQVRYLHD